MSLIIKGVDMPSECRFCPCCADNGLVGVQREYFCSAVDSALEIDNLDLKLSACPLIEIPTTHGRLIDADKLMQWIEHVYGDKDIIKFITDDIKRQPTIVETEVSE